jgi:ArsR family transcriptional regulator, arsenate/arsenite/antimonite-responsive transcriptional repressor
MKTLVEALKALGEENRITIVRMLCEGEMCVCELIERLGLSQSAVSHHVKILKQAGLIRDRRQGKWIFYSLNRDAFESLSLEMQDKVWEPVKLSSWIEKEDPDPYCVSYAAKKGIS